MDAKKIIYRCLLGVAAIVLAYLCVHSVMTPIRFEEKREIREQEVIKNLVHIRTAQNEFKLENGRYAADLDSLVLFLKTTPKKEVYKQGSLTDKQLENGLTEAKAIAIINRAKKTGKTDELKKYDLDPEKFSRDTTWVAVMDTIFPKGFNADSLRYVPFGNGVQFQMDTLTQVARSGAPICLLEVKTPYEVYLGDLDKQEIINLKDQQQQLNKYCGLKIGDLETANNNAGNWE